MKYLTLPLLVLTSISSFGVELPYLSKDIDPETQDLKAQGALPNLSEAYVSTSPKDLNDGLPVGTLDLPGTEEAV